MSISCPYCGGRSFHINSAGTLVTCSNCSRSYSLDSMRGNSQNEHTPPSGFEYHLNVQQLLRLVSAPEIIARAIVVDDLLHNGEDFIDWIETYCKLYVALTTVTPRPSQEPVFLFAEPDDTGLDISGIPADPAQRSDYRTALEFMPPEEYAGIEIPPPLLSRYTAAELASEILREYSWYDGPLDSTARDPLVLYSYTSALLGMTIGSDNIMFDYKDTALLERACRITCDMLQQNKAASVERILEEAGLNFEQYHAFMKDRKKVVTTDILSKNRAELVSENIDTLLTFGYTRREISDVFYTSPVIFGKPADVFQEAFSKAGVHMTRYILTSQPLDTSVLLNFKLETEIDLPLYRAPSRSLFEYALKHKLIIQIKLVNSQTPQDFYLLCCSGDSDGHRIYGAIPTDEEKKVVSIPFSEIEQVNIQDEHCGTDTKLLKQAVTMASQKINGAYIDSLD